MVLQLDLTSILMMMGIPTALTGLFFFILQRKLIKRETRRDRMDEAIKTNEMMIVKCVGASIALGEATAKSLQRLDTQCNGDMHGALEYATRVKHEYKDFLQARGIENLY